MVRRVAPADQPEGVRPSGIAAVALLSAAMLALEMALSRLFALAQFYHFAFMVVSLALLGLGAAGSLLSVRPGLGERPERWCAGFTVAVGVSFAVLTWLPFDSYAIAWDRRQPLLLALTFGAAAAPFLFAGLVIGGRLARSADRLHRVYAANLLGSAAGSLAALPLLPLLGAEGLVAACAAGGLAAAALFAWPTGRRGAAGAALAAALVVAGLAVWRPDWLTVRLSPYKALSYALQAPGARHTVSDWTLAGRVDVVESDAIHVLPGLAQNARVPVPPRQSGVTLDGDDLAPITALAADAPLAREIAANVPEAVAGALRPGGSRLVLFPGGGWPVLTALAAGAGPVTVVERNPRVAELLRADYGPLTHDLYADPRVRLVVAEPRAFLRRRPAPPDRYGAVILGLGDGFHPVTSGAYSLGEDYRYTVEALADALDQVQADGILVATRWLQTPPTEGPRLVATLAAALRSRGVPEPATHLAAFRSLRTITVVASLQPFGAVDLATLRRFVDDRGYDLVWLPDIRPDEVNRHQRVPEPADYEAVATLLADPAGFLADYPYDVRPTTDDRPFFFHFFRWRQTPDVVAGLGRTWQPFGGSGYLVLVFLLGLLIALAAVLILAPLVVGRRGGLGLPRAAAGPALAYFGALGLGYMLVLIPLSQRLILYLGQPVTALAVVSAAVLLFSGLGSLTAPRWRLGPALALLVVAIALLPAAFAWLVPATLTAPLPARLLVTLAVLAPVGWLMGVPFARALAGAERAVPGLTPWAWAVNGSASVVAGVVAVMIALGWGFGAVLWCGAGAYGLAWLAARRLPGAALSAPGG